MSHEVRSGSGPEEITADGRRTERSPVNCVPSCSPSLSLLQSAGINP